MRSRLLNSVRATWFAVAIACAPRRDGALDLAEASVNVLGFFVPEHSYPYPRTGGVYETPSGSSSKRGSHFLTPNCTRVANSTARFLQTCAVCVVLTPRVPDFVHESVLVGEVLEYLSPRDDEVYVDCTLGGGGHSSAILEPRRRHLIGIDRDPAALAAARARLGDRGARSSTASSAISHAILAELGHRARSTASSLDLGVSSPQLDHAERGFSFTQARARSTCGWIRRAARPRSICCATSMSTTLADADQRARRGALRASGSRG